MIRPGLILDVADLESLEAPLLLDTRLALTGPSGRAQYDAGHLPGAAYIDLDADLSAPPGEGGRHPLPEPHAFVAAMRRAGVRRGSVVVVYDAGPATVASRLWWLLRDYGHVDVMVLDGGLAAWVAAGGTVSTEPVDPEPGDWIGSPGEMQVVDADGALDRAGHGLLVDVRAGERFRGETEPLDPVAGHIPGAVSLPLAGNTDDDGRFLGPMALRERFAALAGPPAVYCGSGVTATQTVLALRLAGRDAALYPGSWSGWIADGSRDVATGGV